jgi:SAM-dependent methyltransferase
MMRLGADSTWPPGVTYIAPCDTRNTGLPAGSFDLVISASTFEHIPPDDIPKVLVECRRLLAQHGVCSFWIDYKDHWSYFDRSISAFNYLKYDDRMWALYNPAFQYQNRLRHSDYIRFFREAGFVVHAEPIVEAMPAIKLANRFEKYTMDDLQIVGSWFALRVN